MLESEIPILKEISHTRSISSSSTFLATPNVGPPPLSHQGFHNLHSNLNSSSQTVNIQSNYNDSRGTIGYPERSIGGARYDGVTSSGGMQKYRTSGKSNIAASAGVGAGVDLESDNGRNGNSRGSRRSIVSRDSVGGISSANSGTSGNGLQNSNPSSSSTNRRKMG